MFEVELSKAIENLDNLNLPMRATVTGNCRKNGYKTSSSLSYQTVKSKEELIAFMNQLHAEVNEAGKENRIDSFTISISYSEFMPPINSWQQGNYVSFSAYLLECEDGGFRLPESLPCLKVRTPVYREGRMRSGMCEDWD